MPRMRLFLIALPLLSAVLGCSDANVAVGTPHSFGKDWIAGRSDSHGPTYRAGSMDCAGCHDIGSKCTVCHFDPRGGDARVPPGSDWTHGTRHVSLGSYDRVCNACHSLLRSYGEGPTGCHDCHGSGLPHAIPFTDPALHGAAAKADLSYCQLCHGTSGTTAFDGGPIATTACSTCHLTAKAHPTNWQGAGLYSHRNAGHLATGCALCHDVAQGREAPNPASPSCFAGTWTNGNSQTRACHPDGPGAAHPMGQPWLDKKSVTFHGDAAKQDQATCALCHGLDFQGGTAGVSCYQCHFGPGGDMSPTSRFHVPKSVGSHSTYRAYQDVCNACHDTNRAYGNAPANCHNCHDD